MLYFIISDKDFALTDILEIIFADAKSACQFLTTIPRFLRLGEPTEYFWMKNGNFLEKLSSSRCA